MVRIANKLTNAQVKILHILEDELTVYCEYMSGNVDYDNFETFFIRQGHDVDLRSKGNLLAGGYIENYQDENSYSRGGITRQRITRKGADAIKSDLFIAWSKNHCPNCNAAYYNNEHCEMCGWNEGDEGVSRYDFMDEWSGID